jgi:hypothetical protein
LRRRTRYENSSASGSLAASQVELVQAKELPVFSKLRHHKPQVPNERVWVQPTPVWQVVLRLILVLVLVLIQPTWALVVFSAHRDSVH